MSCHNCPKFEDCNAPLCPLDNNLSSRSYLDGESVCFYVREYAKEDPEIKTDIEHFIFKIVRDKFDLMLRVGGSKYESKIERAKNSESKRKLVKKALNNNINTLQTKIMGGPDEHNKVAL